LRYPDVKRYRSEKQSGVDKKVTNGKYGLSVPVTPIGYLIYGYGLNNPSSAPVQLGIIKTS
jgi:hypothetical protein